MASYVLDESQIRRLSPATRREVLGIIAADLDAVRSAFSDSVWNPEGNESFPLDPAEARLLLHGLSSEACAALRCFVEDREPGGEGHASFQALLERTGHSDLEAVNELLSWILVNLRAVTGHPDAWLIGWRHKDWNWDDAKQAWTEGRYYISPAAADAISEALDSLDEVAVDAG